MRSLIPKNDGRSGIVTLPKEHLERDGLVNEEDGSVEKHPVFVDRVGPGEYKVQIADEQI